MKTITLISWRLKGIMNGIIESYVGIYLRILKYHFYFKSHSFYVTLVLNCLIVACAVYNVGYILNMISIFVMRLEIIRYFYIKSTRIIINFQNQVPLVPIPIPTWYLHLNYYYRFAIIHTIIPVFFLQSIFSEIIRVSY